MLSSEFRGGRVPIYVLDRVLMTPAELSVAIDPTIKTLWITKDICDEPIQHEMFSEQIGTDRTAFRLFTKESRIRHVEVADSVDEELVEILSHILSVASFSKCITTRVDDPCRVFIAHSTWLATKRSILSQNLSLSIKELLF